jgi:hypothetical protein
VTSEFLRFVVPVDRERLNAENTEEKREGIEEKAGCCYSQPFPLTASFLCALLLFSVSSVVNHFAGFTEI